MTFKKLTLLCLAATFIPSGVVLPTDERKPKQTVSEKVKEHWQTFKKWWTVERFCCSVLGAAALYLGWQQYKGNDVLGIGNGGQGNGPSRLSFANGDYANRLQPTAAADLAPIQIQGQNNRQITIEQRAVVNQRGPTCPYHSAANADLIADSLNNPNDANLRNAVRNPAIVGQRVEQLGQHIEQVINGQVQFNDPAQVAMLNAVDRNNPRTPEQRDANRQEILREFRASTASDGWAEAPIVRENLQANPAHVVGHSDVAWFADGVPQHNEVALQQPGIHRVVFASAEAAQNSNTPMGKHGVHYYSCVINRDQQGNARYVFADSLNNRDRRRERMVSRFISQIEFNSSENDNIAQVTQSISNAIQAQRAPAVAPVPAAPGGPQLEADIKRNADGTVNVPPPPAH